MALFPKPLKASQVVLTALALGTCSAASAAPPPTGRAEALKAVTDCRTLTEDAARLACYDKTVAALDQAEAQGKVAVVDREQVRAVRRQAFGFNLPSLTFFMHGPRDESVDKITVELAGAHQNAEGKWVMTTVDNGVWQQTDTEAMFNNPHNGSKLDVRKGLLGSFFCKVDGQRAVRCKRVE